MIPRGNKPTAAGNMDQRPRIFRLLGNLRLLSDPGSQPEQELKINSSVMATVMSTPPSILYKFNRQPSRTHLFRSLVWLAKFTKQLLAMAGLRTLIS